jgi:hypothetical protein
MRGLSEFAVIAKRAEFEFLFVGQMSTWAEGKTSKPASRSQMTLMYATAG